MRYINIPDHIPTRSKRISADAVKQALEESGLEYLVTLPESSYEILLRQLVENSSLKIVQVCRECEGMGICSGMTYGGKKAALLCSYKGFYNSIDSLLGVALKTQASFPILVSEALVGEDSASENPERGRHSEALLKALEIPYYVVECTEDVPFIHKAFADTKNNTQPVAIILRW